MNTLPTDAKAIFLAAIDQTSPDERARLLDECCGEDGQLRSRVEQLLASHGDAGNFLGGSWSVGVDDEASNSEMIGTEIGPYKLLEQIGEGGFGVVYLAEQNRPVRREVALKVVKAGMDTKEVVARFEAERQALALMDHPNIAKVLDAGGTESGRPYFVMELVKGVPITDYCDECQLTARDRLELFVRVCQAVQHAHQKGIIHRDIKPSNVLVAMQDGRAAPKIIDFGVAKALNQRLTERTLRTAHTQMIGTPMYMSPEQAELSPLNVDTRSDIYSLGVLLYELLTGSTPFDQRRIAEAGFDEMRRIIREEEPPLPSTRLSTLSADLATTIAEQRRTDPKRLRQLVRGELDWIVMKCLERDRGRRYESASAVAQDVRRYSSDEPVLARPASWTYRMAKLVRRNRTLVASLAAVLVALGAGLAVAAVGFRQAVAQRDLARQAEQTTERRLAEITKEQENNEALIELLSDMYPRPWGMKTLGRQQTVYESIEELSASLKHRLRKHPAVEIEVRQIFGGAYSAAGDFDNARDHLNLALELALQHYGEQHETVAEIYAALADEVGWNYSGPRDNTTWLAQAEKAIEIYAALGVEESSGLQVAWFAKGNSLLAWPERKAEAEVAQRKCVEIHRRRARGEGGKEPVISRWDLGLLIMHCGDDRLDEAQIEFEKALETCRSGDRGPMIEATVLSGLGRCLRRQGDAVGAIESFREAWDRYQSDEEGRSEPRGYRVGLRLAETYFAVGDIDGAFKLVRQIEELLTREDLVESLVDCLLLKGWLHFQLESYDSAAQSFMRAMELAEEHLGERSTKFGYPCLYLAMSLEAQQRPNEAAAYYQRLLPLTAAFIDMSHVDPTANWCHARALLGTVGDDREQLETALGVAQEGLDHVARWPWPWLEPAFHQTIAKVHHRRGQQQAAIDALKMGLQAAQEPKATLRSSPYGPPSARHELEVMLTSIYLEDGETGKNKAKRVLKEGVRIRAEALGDNHIQVALAKLRLGEFLFTQSDYAAAEQPLLEAYAKLQPYSKTADAIRLRVATLLAENHTKMGQPQEAVQWQSKVDAARRSSDAIERIDANKSGR